MVFSLPVLVHPSPKSASDRVISYVVPSHPWVYVVTVPAAQVHTQDPTHGTVHVDYVASYGGGLARVNVPVAPFTYGIFVRESDLQPAV